VRRVLILLLIIPILYFGNISLTYSQGASLYLSPASGTFFVGSTFDVSVFVNTGGEYINAVEVNMKFDPAKLQVASPTAGKSFIEVWVAQPTFSNTQGTMSFIGGVPSPGIKTSSGLVSTVTFRAISPGETSILFEASCKALRNDPHGTNILTSMSRGVYNLSIPPPEGPRIFSSTHPDQNKWYKNNNPTFSWEKEEGVTEFSYILDLDPTGVPDNIPEGDRTSFSYSDVGDGIWYFHVKAKKEEIWGGVSHYIARIDNSPPALFTPTVEPAAETAEPQPLVSFFTTDALSGVDFYQIKYIDISPEKKEEAAGFFTETISPHKLPPLEVGRYLVIVRAYDVAGNWREGTVKTQIYPKGILFTRKGIRFREFLFPWWILVLILIIIIALIIFFVWRRYKKIEKKRKEELGGIEKTLTKIRNGTGTRQ